MARTGVRAGGSARVLHCLRHGRTEMNEYLAEHAWDAPDFRDPLLYDTRLTAAGEAEAQRARARVQGLTQGPYPPDVIICSPLTRALRTMELAFADVLADVPVVVTHLGAERVYHSSDIGVLRSDLEEKFPYDFSGLPPGPWWYCGEQAAGVLGAGERGVEAGGGATEGAGAWDIVKEPGPDFLDRMRRFKEFLVERPEKRIAYVGHWAVLYALTGYDFDNCELVSTKLDKLVDFEDLDPDFA